MSMFFCFYLRANSGLFHFLLAISLQSVYYISIITLHNYKKLFLEASL